MNAIKSLIRHLLTFLAGMGTYFAAKGLIPADNAAAVDSAGAALVEPLTYLLVILAIAFARTLMAKMPWLGTGAFTGSAGTQGLAVSGGTLAACALAGGVGTALPACSPQAQEALKNTPVKACYIDENGNRICYSTQDGVSVEVDRRSGK